ncbi:MAG: DNA recombination protein RmuC [Dehalococcoidia bacterium]
MEAIIIVLLIAVLVAISGAMYYFVRQGQEAGRAAQSQMEAQRQEMSARLDQQRQEMNERLDRVQSNISHSLTSTSETIGDINKQLGQMYESTRQVLDVGKDISALQDLLKPPKLRGGFGEMLLEQLLSQVLPAEGYGLQHRFRSGEVVDAVIRLPEGMVPIDSKFPIEAFRRVLEAGTDEERARQRRSFVREVGNRIDEVAKYIRPDEGTLDFALMYIPAENVYYETIVGVEGESPMTQALEKRVYLVSPNTFYAFLQALTRGLHIIRVEEHAREILGRLDQLKHDFSKFQSEFGVLGTHIGHAKNKYDELDKMADSFGGRLARPLEQEWAELPVSSAAGELPAAGEESAEA